MIRVLLTGMSGTGKSSVLTALAARGYCTLDMDDPGWSEYAPDGDWVWNAARLHDLLATDTAPVLFISGCAANQGQFYPRFTQIILLSAPAEILMERLLTRTINPYGQRPEERAAVLHNLATVEPLLRRRATHEIDTRIPLEEVVATILRLVGLPGEKGEHVR